MKHLAQYSTPLTLRALRERTDQKPSLYDQDDWGACGCSHTAQDL
jgi:hypothetical protein